MPSSTSEVKGDDLGHNRVVQLPARSFTLASIWKACQEVAQQEGITSLGKVTRGELPKVHTCFYELELPVYQSAEQCAEKFRYALDNFYAIDSS